MVFKGNGLVWNPNTNTAYRFIDGEYETNDPDKIAFLKSRGFEHDGEEDTIIEASKTITKKTKRGQA